jgi:hypothetical protein
MASRKLTRAGSENESPSPVRDGVSAARATSARPVSAGLSEARLEQHRRQVERIRAKHGDPEVAMQTFMREHFDEETAMRLLEEYVDNHFILDE